MALSEYPDPAELSDQEIESVLSQLQQQQWKIEDSSDYSLSEWYVYAPSGGVYRSDEFRGQTRLVDDDALDFDMLTDEQLREEVTASYVVGLLQTRTTRALARALLGESSDD